MNTKITIEKMIIRNFKGIKELVINFEGKNTNIYGDNATGKTSIFDAFLWTLFNKNSDGKTDFGWKPIDMQGNEIHNLETSVEIIMQINGNSRSLKKCAVENWVKKRGNATQVFEGNINNYWLDEVPTKASDFQKFIDSTINEQKFKMITNPLFFGSQMTPDEQRTVVSSIAEINNLTDEKIMQENEEFTLLCEKLNGRSVNDFMKIVKETIKKLNDEIDNIPVRIDEITKTMIMVDERELKAANDGMKACEIRKDLINGQINDVQSRRRKNGELITSLATKQKELEELKNKINLEKNANLTEERNRTLADISKIESELKLLDIKIQTAEKNITVKEEELQNLRIKFDTENKKEFKDENNYICPVCNREYEEHTKAEMLNKAKSVFIEQRAKILEQINSQGTLLSDFVKSSKEELVNNQKLHKENEEKLKHLKEKVETLKDIEPDYSSDDRFVGLEKEVNELEQKVNSIQVETIEKFETQLNEIQENMNEYKKVLLKKETQINAEKRIEELKEEEKSLSDQILEQEHLKNSIEEFTKTKISLLEEKINENFEIVNFKLFENQINGGVREVCYATVDGVPYSDLNSAMKINAGLDVIKTLTKFYGVQAPIFIDNKESINNLINIDAQIISLIVSHDPKLKVEVI